MDGINHAPGDRMVLNAAIERLIGDGDLRERLVRNGRALMADNTLEANRSRVLAVLRNEVCKFPRGNFITRRDVTMRAENTDVHNS